VSSRLRERVAIGLRLARRLQARALRLEESPERRLSRAARDRPASAGLHRCRGGFGRPPPTMRSRIPQEALLGRASRPSRPVPCRPHPHPLRVPPPGAGRVRRRRLAHGCGRASNDCARSRRHLRGAAARLEQLGRGVGGFASDLRWAIGLRGSRRTARLRAGERGTRSPRAHGHADLGGSVCGRGS
jgi:hypothetical protein